MSNSWTVEEDNDANGWSISPQGGEKVEVTPVEPLGIPAVSPADPGNELVREPTLHMETGHENNAADPRAGTRWVWWLVFTILPMCIFLSSHLILLIGVGNFPKYASFDSGFEIYSGWSCVAIAYILNVVVAVRIILIKHPYRPVTTLCYLFMTTLYLIATSLHTNMRRLDETKKPAVDLVNSSIQLQWIGCVFVFLTFTVLLWMAPIQTPDPASDAFRDLRLYEMQRHLRKVKNNTVLLQNEWAKQFNDPFPRRASYSMSVSRSRSRSQSQSHSRHHRHAHRHHHNHHGQQHKPPTGSPKLQVSAPLVDKQRHPSLPGQMGHLMTDVEREAYLAEQPPTQ